MCVCALVWLPVQNSRGCRGFTSGLTNKLHLTNKLVKAHSRIDALAQIKPTISLINQRVHALSPFFFPPPCEPPLCERLSHFPVMEMINGSKEKPEIKQQGQREESKNAFVRASGAATGLSRVYKLQAKRDVITFTRCASHSSCSSMALASYGRLEREPAI